MVTPQRYTVQYRRKRKGKTDYKSRLALLKSRTARFTVRKSLKNIMCQIIEYFPAGDKVVAHAVSTQLKSVGWKCGTGNIPAAYLTGYLLGKKALKAGIKEAVIDLGLQNAMPKGRLFAAVKGAKEAGLKTNVSEDVLPSDERVKGEHIKLYSENKEAGKPDHQFAAIRKNGASPEKISSLVEEAKKKIDAL